MDLVLQETSEVLLKVVAFKFPADLLALRALDDEGSSAFVDQRFSSHFLSG